MVKHHFPILKAPCFSPGAQHAGHGTVRTAGSAGSGGPGSRGKAGKISCHGSYDISYGYDVYGKTWENHGKIIGNRWCIYIYIYMYICI